MSMPSKEWWVQNAPSSYTCTYCEAWAKWYDTRHDEMLCTTHKTVNNTHHLYMEEVD